MCENKNILHTVAISREKFLIVKEKVQKIDPIFLYNFSKLGLQAILRRPQNDELVSRQELVFVQHTCRHRGDFDWLLFAYVCNSILLNIWGSVINETVVWTWLWTWASELESSKEEKKRV